MSECRNTAAALKKAFLNDRSMESELAWRRQQAREAQEKIPVNEVRVDLRSRLVLICTNPESYCVSESFKEKYPKGYISYLEAVQDFPEPMLAHVLSQRQLPIYFEHLNDMLAIPEEHNEIIQFVTFGKYSRTNNSEASPASEQNLHDEVGFFSLEETQLDVMDQIKADSLSLSGVEKWFYYILIGVQGWGQSLRYIDMNVPRPDGMGDYFYSSIVNGLSSLEKVKLSGAHVKIDEICRMIEYSEVLQEIVIEGDYAFYPEDLMEALPKEKHHIVLGLEELVRNIKREKYEKHEYTASWKGELEKLSKNKPELTALVIDTAKIGREEWQVLGNFSYLRDLMLGGTNEDYFDLLSSLKSLETLHIDYHDTMNASMIDKLKDLPKLSDLLVSSCGSIERPELEALGRLSKLKSLTLGYIFIDDEEIQELSTLRSIVSLTLEEIEGLSGSGLRKLLPSLKSLKEISIDACPDIDEAQMEALQEENPDLEISRK